MGDDRVSSFGPELRRLRLAAGLSQEELAARAGLTAKAVSKLERGERLRPHPHTIRLLAAALGLEGAAHDAFTLAARGGKENSSGTRPVARGEAASAAPVGAFLGAAPDGPLIGRHEELGEVLRVVEEPRGGIGRLVLLAGEPGVGKTRLAQEVALDLERRGFLVLTGRCYEPERTVPFFPFLEILAQAQRAAPASLRGDVPERWPYLARLLPDSPLASPLSTMGAEDPLHLMRSVSGFFEALGGSRPLAVLLDDLQWADESSLRLLRHLTRFVRHPPAVFVGTYRDDEYRPDHLLARALFDLDREGLVARIHLADLDEADTSRFIDALIGQTDPAFGRWVQGHTEGNPFFTRELVRSLIDRGALVQHDGPWEWRDPERIEVPASVRSLIAQRVARLTPRAQEILRQASVLGQTFALDLLVALGAWSEEAAETALDEAAAARLVRAVGDEAYAFDHALTQQALYADLGERHRRRLHRAAAEALESRTESDRARIAAELSRHFLEGSVPERAFHWSMLAGDRAEAVFAHPEAEQHFRQAVELASGLGDAAREARAREKLGALLTTVGRYDEALAILEPAIQTYAALGDAERLAATLAPALWAHGFRGTAGEGIARAEPLLHDLDRASPSSALALLYVKLATIFHFASRYDAQLQAGKKATDLATRVGDDRVLAEAEDVHGYALCLLGRIEDGLSVLEHGRALAESTDHPVARSNILGHLAITHLLNGRFADAGREVDGAVAAAQRLGDPQLAMTWKGLVGMHRILVGDWSEARRQLEETLASDDANPLPYSLFLLGWLEMLEGTWERAGSLLARSAGISERIGHLQALRYARQFQARLDVVSGHPDRAIDRLSALLDRSGLEEQDVTTFLPVLAWARLEQGDLAPALELAASAVERAQRQRHLLARVEASLVLGMALTRSGRWAEAEPALSESRNLAHSLPYPHAEALALREQGILDLARGEPDRAQARLAEGLAIFQRLGARPDAEQTARRMDCVAAR